jgi:hypothetical protein
MGSKTNKINKIEQKIVKDGKASNDEFEMGDDECEEKLC